MGFKIKGGLAGSADRIKQDQARSKQGPRTYIRRVKDGESLDVRFMTEPDGWFSFREYYVQGIGYFPDANLQELGIDLPEGTRNPSKRYLANAYLPGEDKVVPLLLPLDLASRIVMRFDRNGTVQDRDFVLHRAGSGVDTKYDVETADKESRDMSDKSLLDLGLVLQRQFEDAFGMDPMEVDETEEAESPTEVSSSTGEGDDGTLTEEQALAMDEDDLVLICEQIGVERSGNESKAELVELIFADS